MRNYFKENEGKPLAPAKAPRSAYTIFHTEEVERIGCSASGTKGTGKNKKNYNKEIGASWAALPADRQATYEATCEKAKGVYGACFFDYQCVFYIIL